MYCTVLANSFQIASLLTSFFRSEGISEEFKTEKKEALGTLMEALPNAIEILEDSFREILGADIES